MPKFTEKKYKVANFDEIVKRLNQLGAKPLSSSESHHYYAQQDILDVTKLVISPKKCEIHILKETNGTFKLINNIPVKDKKAGIDWLKDNGFDTITYIKMAHADYGYSGGIVGLYVINDKLHSVILDYPVKKQPSIAKQLGLENAEVIEKPYNQYLQEVPKDRNRNNDTR